MIPVLPMLLEETGEFDLFGQLKEPSQVGDKSDLKKLNEVIFRRKEGLAS